MKSKHPTISINVERQPARITVVEKEEPSASSIGTGRQLAPTLAIGATSNRVSVQQQQDSSSRSTQ